MNILIIEDEKHNSDRLIRLLKGYDENIRIYGPLTSVSSILEFSRKQEKIDLILSDIRLTDGLSLDGLNELSDNIPVIFTTAYDEYALKAFNCNGIAYLLKPIDKDELAEAIDKSKRMFARTNQNDIAELYRMLQGKSETYRQRFLVHYRDGFSIVSVSEISYIYTESGIVRLCLKNGRHFSVDMSLDDIESQLDPGMFFRATRQHIVSITSVARITNWFNRKIKIILTEYPETEIVVGKEKVTRIKQWLDQ